ncbi:hypothetical protein [Flavobacterium sp. 245]|uniref:hypothetical protein n=1 Tax=Flavobacterium sp. 245 TaxID=2512115 RepID=UPI00105FD1E0|nr:hypothetical protein [Flavobacterium sp. 245]TDO95614.1 hypothetical protein EV145_11329 [Flavobacterium sp. 245]
MKKRILTALFLLSFVFANSQIVKPFVGGGVYIHSDFENSGFLSLRSGAEFNASKYIKPEIEISGLIGSLESSSKLDANNVMVAEISRSVSAVNFSFCPKIILGNELVSYFEILPKYSISTIEAHKNSYNYTNGNFVSSKMEIAKEWSQSIGIGIGYCFNFSDEYSDAMSLILDFQNVDLGKPLNKLSPNASRVDTKWTLGFGINYYFNLRKKKF